MDEGARDRERDRTIMAKMKKPTHQPSLLFPPAADELHQDETWLRVPLRKKWREVTNKPEETVSYGLQKAPANRPGLHARPYLRVANVQLGRLVLDEIKRINVPDSDMPALKLEVADILFIEGNGSRAESGKTTSGLGTINSTVIRTAPIPLPSIDIQRDQIDALSTAQTKADQVRTEAATLRQSAWTAFESALFTAGEATA